MRALHTRTSTHTHTHTADEGAFKLDLKGVLYHATVLPLGGTAVVANIGPTEAKVCAHAGGRAVMHARAAWHGVA
jgi:hypothetical protein